jgi:hypothetical protein
VEPLQEITIVENDKSTQIGVNDMCKQFDFDAARAKSSKFVEGVGRDLCSDRDGNLREDKVRETVAFLTMMKVLDWHNIPADEKSEFIGLLNEYAWSKSHDAFGRGYTAGRKPLEVKDAA